MCTKRGVEGIFVSAKGHSPSIVYCSVPLATRQVKAVTVESVGQPDAGDSSYIVYRTRC